MGTLAAPRPAVPTGPGILRQARIDRRAAKELLRAFDQSVQASICQELRPGLRSEFLMLVDHPEHVVPLLPSTELCITMRAGAMSEAAWLLELATPEQRQACLDLDVWNGASLEIPRLLEWIDALIEAGRPTLARAITELDPELWVLLLKRNADIAIVGREDEPPDGYFTEDGVVYVRARSDDDFARLREVLQTAFADTQPDYWRFVYGALHEHETECEEFALRWRVGRLADLGFPDREWAMQAYRPLDPAEIEPVALTQWQGELTQLAQRVTLPRALSGTLVGEALSALPAESASDILGYVLGVANSIAVADQIPLSEEESVPAALRKAVAGIDVGLRELARRRDQSPEEVLQVTRPLDLFRVGVTCEPAVRAIDIRPAVDDDGEADEGA